MRQKLLSILALVCLTVSSAWAQSYTITLPSVSNGSVTAKVNDASVTSAAAGATVSLVATPDAGYRLKTISGTYQVNPQETLSKGAATRTGNYFTLTASYNSSAGWNLYSSHTITIEGLDGGNISTVVLNITPRASFAFNEMSVNHGSMTRDGNVITISGINSSSVVITGTNRGGAYGCVVTSATITGTGTVDKALSLTSTGDDNVKTFTMPSSNVTVSAEFELAPIAVTGVTLSQTSGELTVGGATLEMTPTVAPGDATDKTVKWSVAQEGSIVALYTDQACTQAVGTDAIAAAKVYVKPLAAGQATVTVTTNDGAKTATCTVTVNVVASWVGNSAINANGTWYYAGNYFDWCTGGAFNGAELGTITELSLGGQSQAWAEGSANWNDANLTMTMGYKIDGGEAQSLSLNWYDFANNNNKFQSGGSSWAPQDIDISGLTPGYHTIAVWFNRDAAWDSNNSADYVASFSIPATLTANEGETGEYWATYYNSTTSFTADANTTVYQAALNGNYLTLEEVEGREIPVGNAVILKSTAASITLTPGATSAIINGNVLQGTTAAIDGSAGNIYVLNKVDGKVGFYKLSSTGTLGANKAYLTVSEPTAPSFYGFSETTGINSIDNGQLTIDNSVYDLQGRRVQNPSKGLYIVNGKKVVIK